MRCLFYLDGFITTNADLNIEHFIDNFHIENFEKLLNRFLN